MNYFSKEEIQMTNKHEMFKILRYVAFQTAVGIYVIKLNWISSRNKLHQMLVRKCRERKCKRCGCECKLVCYC